MLAQSQTDSPVAEAILIAYTDVQLLCIPNTLKQLPKYVSYLIFYFQKFEVDSTHLLLEYLHSNKELFWFLLN